MSDEDNKVPMDTTNVSPAEAEDLVGAEQANPQVESAPAAEAAPSADDWHDKYLRLFAEFDNYRKRSARDFGELVRNAERDLIADLTEVLDNFGRALDTDHKGESVAEFAKGMSLIRDQFWTALSKRGLERMETVGNPFDPGQHDAMVRMPSNEYDEGVVMQEVSPGYRLGNKVLKYARVVVSQGKGETGSENGRTTAREGEAPAEPFDGK